jgi:hypothetical protein
LFWNPPCTNFTEVTFVAEDFIGRTMTDPHLVCHFVDSHPTSTCSVFPSLVSVDGYSNIHQFSHAYMLFFGKILSPYSADSIQWISTALNTISPQNFKYCVRVLLFFGACVKVSGMWMPPVVKDNWMVVK